MIVCKDDRNCLICSLKKDNVSLSRHHCCSCGAIFNNYSAFALWKDTLSFAAAPLVSNSKQTNSVGQQMVNGVCPSVVPPRVTLPILPLPHADTHMHARTHAPAPLPTSLPAFSSALLTKHLLNLKVSFTERVEFLFCTLALQLNCKSFSLILLRLCVSVYAKSFLPF